MWIFSREMSEKIIKDDKLRLGSVISTTNGLKGEVIKKTKDYITIRYYDVNHHFDRRYKIIDKVQRVKKIKLTPRIKELTS
mgnify:FL=1